MESIHEKRDTVNLSRRSREWWERNQDSLSGGIMLLMGVVLAGGLLRLGTVWREQGPITQIGEESPLSDERLYERYLAAGGFPGLVAASRNGARYYYPWCGGLNRIKEENKIWFKSVEEAKRAGYTMASGCE